MTSRLEPLEAEPREVVRVERYDGKQFTARADEYGVVRNEDGEAFSKGPYEIVEEDDDG